MGRVTRIVCGAKVPQRAKTEQIISCPADAEKRVSVGEMIFLIFYNLTILIHVSLDRQLRRLILK